MLKIGVIAFSLTGEALGEKIRELLKQDEYAVTLSVKCRYSENCMKESLREWTKTAFEQNDALIFIGACGIAVRAIAPYVVSKTKDPAILSVDECGKHVISLMSGHLGGANELTLHLSELLGADPVISTATDLHAKFAVDVFAKKHDMAIKNMKAAKLVSAALLSDEPVGFYTDLSYEGELPEGIYPCKTMEEAGEYSVGIVITCRKDLHPFEHTTVLIPKCISVGVGCRKGKDYESIKEFFEENMLEAGLYTESVSELASIDLKKDETGICSLAEEYQYPFVVYSQEELLEVDGDFSASGFVKSITGVDNVCERSAVRASGNGRLMIRKIAENGMTMAAAIKEWRICFE